MDSPSKKSALRRHWKWLAVSALGVAWIISSCGRLESSTNPICTSITTAIHGLLSLIGTQENATKNNIKTDVTYRPITLLNPHTYQNSSAHYVKLTPITRFGTFTAENMVRKTKDLTITYVCSIIHLTTKYSKKTTKASIRTPARRWRNIGRTVSQPLRNLISGRPHTQQVTASKKSQAKKPGIIISVAMSTEKPTGYFPNIFECQLAEKSPVG